MNLKISIIGGLTRVVYLTINITHFDTMRIRILTDKKVTTRFEICKVTGNNVEV